MAKHALNQFKGANYVNQNNESSFTHHWQYFLKKNKINIERKN